MPTPPPTIKRLPYSPSSARLRRIAPSPVKIPRSASSSPSSIIYPAAAAAATGPGETASPRTRKLKSKHDVLSALSTGSTVDTSPPPFTPSSSESEDQDGEYDFCPLDCGVGMNVDAAGLGIGGGERTCVGGWLTPSPIEMSSASSPLFSLPSLAHDTDIGEPNSAWKKETCIPIIFDSRGEFGRLASLWRVGESGLDIPDCICMDLDGAQIDAEAEAEAEQGLALDPFNKGTGTEEAGKSQNPIIGSMGPTSKRRRGHETLAPKRYMAECVPRPVLVEFRTDVFSLSGREAIRKAERETIGESTPRVGIGKVALTFTPKPVGKGEVEVGKELAREEGGRQQGEDQDLLMERTERMFSTTERASCGTFGFGSPAHSISDSTPGRPEPSALRGSDQTRSANGKEVTEVILNSDDEHDPYHDLKRCNNDVYESGCEQDDADDNDNDNGDGDGDSWSFMLSAYEDDRPRKGSLSTASMSEYPHPHSRNNSYRIEIEPNDPTKGGLYQVTLDEDGSESVGLKVEIAVAAGGGADTTTTANGPWGQQDGVDAQKQEQKKGRMRFVPPHMLDSTLDSPASDLVVTPRDDCDVRAQTKEKGWPYIADGGEETSACPSPTPKPKPKARPGPGPGPGQKTLSQPQATSSLSPFPSPSSTADAHLVQQQQDEVIAKGEGEGKLRSQTKIIDKALPSLPRPREPTVMGAKNEEMDSRQSVRVPPLVGKVEARPSGPGGPGAVGAAEDEVDLVQLALRGVDKSMTVQLWVDQEGTRSHRTTFKYLRSIRPATFRERELAALQEAAAWCESPTRPEMFQQTGCWVFGMEPKERERWSFDSAALEGLPVLHRLTVNNDDRHDFLSRGATLQIKHPGVYAVYGNEDVKHGRAGREWKFEYLVQPQVSSTGEEVGGEKLVVPLALYVSPAFFSPEKAHKTHLLNVFKKTLTPNVVSEKVRPPHIGKPPQAQGISPSSPTLSPPAAAPAPAPQSWTGRQHTSAPLPPLLPRAVQHSGRPSTSGGAEGSRSSGAATLGRLGGGKGGGSKHWRHRSEIDWPSDTAVTAVAGASTVTSTSTVATPHTRSVSRTIGALAKAVSGLTSSSNTPTQATHPDLPATPTLTLAPHSAGVVGVHKFGTKGRNRTATTSSVLPYPDQAQGRSGLPSPVASGEDKKKEKEKNKTRSRAASLFSRSRPFTPPVNITALHPVPALSPSPSPSPAAAAAAAKGPMPLTSLANARALKVNGDMLGPPAPSNGTSLSLPLQSYRGRGRPTTSPSIGPASSRGSSPRPCPRPFASGHDDHATQVQAPSQMQARPQFTPQGQGQHLHPFYQKQQQPCGSFVHDSTPGLSRSASTSTSTSTSSRSPTILTPIRGRSPSPTRNVYEDAQQMQIAPAGLTPAPRKRPGMRKRPSTAEPRLGM